MPLRRFPGGGEKLGNMKAMVQSQRVLNFMWLCNSHCLCSRIFIAGAYYLMKVRFRSRIKMRGSIWWSARLEYLTGLVSTTEHRWAETAIHVLNRQKNIRTAIEVLRMNLFSTTDTGWNPVICHVLYICWVYSGRMGCKLPRLALTSTRLCLAIEVHHMQLNGFRGFIGH